MDRFHPERHAMRAMLLFIDSEAESIAHALQHLAERCAEDERDALVAGEIAIAQLCHESASAWAAKRARLLELYEALPDREAF